MHFVTPNCNIICTYLLRYFTGFIPLASLTTVLHILLSSTILFKFLYLKSLTSAAIWSTHHHRGVPLLHFPSILPSNILSGPLSSFTTFPPSHTTFIETIMSTLLKTDLTTFLSNSYNGHPLQICTKSLLYK